MLKKFSNQISLLPLIFTVFAVGVFAQTVLSQDPGSQRRALIGNLNFSVPKGFNIQEQNKSGIAFMKHSKYPVALFVAVSDKSIDEQFIQNTSKTAVSLFLPKENNPFKWKEWKDASKTSKFQTISGGIKGFNKNTFVQTDYVVLKVKEKEVLVGYIMADDTVVDTQYLMNLEGEAGASMPGLYAQAHIIASITGERYEQINPGVMFTTTPLKKN